MQSFGGAAITIAAAIHTKIINFIIKIINLLFRQGYFINKNHFSLGSCIFLRTYLFGEGLKL